MKVIRIIFICLLFLGGKIYSQNKVMDSLKLALKNATHDSTKCKILRGLGGGLDEVAVGVVEKMPNWKPGKQGGKNVAVLFTLPIEFELP